MSELKPEEQMEAYSEAVKSGLYAKKSGLVGKYDNVRKYWEDEVTRIQIRSYLQGLLHHCQQQMRRIRIMDLGCGSADGYELLMGVRDRDPGLDQDEVDLLRGSVLGLYKGTDLSDDLLEQAAEIYGHDPKMQFGKGDFTQGLPLGKDEKPYDLYFTSYGTCSHHNDDDTLVDMLAEIAERAEDYTVVVCDWLGRYSYEWQDLWTDDHASLRNMDYVVSYIYDEKEREEKRDQLQHLTLRLMSREEGEDVVKRASKKAGVEIEALHWFDRSVFTGRHIDTGEYNPGPQRTRNAVNSLHETNTRTNFDELYFDYVPKPGMDFLNCYYEQLQVCWNTLVDYVTKLIELYDEEKHSYASEPPSIPAMYPEPLRDVMKRMRQVVGGVGWYPMGLPRENIIEPQLGYALRYLVSSMQQGQGCGHGLVAVLGIKKPS